MATGAALGTPWLRRRGYMQGASARLVNGKGTPLAAAIEAFYFGGVGTRSATHGQTSSSPSFNLPGLVLVGTTSGGSTNGGTSGNYNVSLSGVDVRQGDVVVVSVGKGGVGSASGGAASAPTVTGNNNGAYTGAGAAVWADDTLATDFRLFYKVQGATPDTQITTEKAGSSGFASAVAIQVWRGADTIGVLDATGTPTTTTNGSRGDAPSVSPSTAGAIVIAAGAGQQGASGSAFTIPSGMSDGVSIKQDGATSDTGTWIASYAWVSGAYDPAAVTGGFTDANCSAAAQTIALRPRPAATVNSAAQAQAAGSPSLASAATLALADAVQAQAAGSPSLAAASAVAVDATAQAQAASAPGIASASAIVPAGASHGHVASVPTVSVAGALACDSGVHVQAAASPTLLAFSAITPTSAGHGQAAASPALAAASTASPADAAQAQAAGSPAIAVGGSLSVDGTAQAQLAAIVSIGAASSIAPASAAQAHAATAPVIAAAWSIAVDAAAQAQVAGLVTIKIPASAPGAFFAFF